MKLIRPLGITIFLLLLLTQYQNCASNSPSQSAQNVRIVSDLATQKVAFIEQKVELQDATQEALINGLCADPAPFSWTVTDEAGRTLEAANSSCETGGFQIRLKKVATYPCGVPLSLMGRLSLSRKCPPLMARQISRSDDGRDICFLELENTPPVGPELIGHTAPRQCLQSCYREGIMTLQRSMDDTSCKGLNPSEN